MADVFEDEAEQTVTIGEYIEGLEAQELEADLVLGGDEGKECTYAQGYMKRQAIFSCLTCVPGGNAGVCTACSLSCHDGHEIVELWTKRKFRCDCGNSKFGEFFCKLYGNKEPENADNSYNQNFKGSYCTCGRPYPDPQAEEQVEMIQCCICEDWLHENHLGLDSLEEIPRDEEGEPLYEEFICQECALTCSFLRLYPASIWATLRQKNPAIIGREETFMENGLSACKNLDRIENGILAPVTKIDCPNIPVESASCDKDASNGENTDLDVEKPSACNLDIASSSRCSLGLKDASNGENTDLDVEKPSACNLDIASSSRCSLGLDIAETSTVMEKTKPMFLSKKWRELLCRCTTCVEFYSRKGINYLIDKEDSLEEYEKVAKKKREEKLQKEEGAELNFLNKLNHVQKIEILSGIADMKNEFMSFLESFDSSKPITSADVKEVFENLTKKKKQRLA